MENAHRVLNILKSEPDAMTLELLDLLDKEGEAVRFELFRDPDYTSLVDLIFSSERIVCWW